MSDVTRILSSSEQGDPQAAEKLLPLVYEELRRMAAQKLARKPSELTLQPTARVHEAYIFIAGLTGDQSAAVLVLPPRAADPLWARARAWLFDWMHPDGR